MPLKSVPRAAVAAACYAAILAAGCRVAATHASSAPADPLLAHEAEIKALVAQMTLAEKIGQMAQADQASLKDPSDIERLGLGSILFGGDSVPKGKNTVAGWAELHDHYQSRALKTRLAIPMLMGTDGVHGHSNVVGTTIFPHNIGLGCARDAALVEKIERITAEEMRATGFHWTFAPCVAVPQDIRWGRTYEGFSEDPALVAEMGVAATRGFQDASLADPLAVLACGKHFAGDGGTAWGSARNKRLNEGDDRMDEATFRRIHVAPYPPMIRAGLGSIMPSFSSLNGVKMSANHYLLTDVLKGELRFNGFFISDWNAIDQITPDYKKCVEISANAGMDMFMVPARYREFIKDLTELVNEGKVPQSRIDDAVTRILRAKFALGLMDKGRSPMADRSLWPSVGSPEHRAIARQAVRESLVLLKNENRALPLARSTKRIAVAGKCADNLGYQCGGWSIKWQGTSGNKSTIGTTILEAIRQAAPGVEVSYSMNGKGGEGATVGVVVVGEKPYAEGKGDRASLALDKDDMTAIKNMKAAGIPFVVVLVSGRPMILGDALADADAVVAAWLPGTEGEGVADVLFGDYKPTGKLSYSWPRSIDQLPLNINKKPYDPLFPLGHGLSY